MHLKLHIPDIAKNVISTKEGNLELSIPYMKVCISDLIIHITMTSRVAL